ncbi:MAG: ABC transporter ATP-binding protein [Bacilli bacterium]|nr:ABC transporter ATP-binding protein [Bacilli bacterium]
MKNKNAFSIIFRYLKNDKLKLFVYLVLVLFSYLPGFLGAFFWGFALEKLVLKDFNSFAMYVIIWESIWILFCVILSIPRDMLYNYLEIKFTKNVSKDLYVKMSNLPAKAFEEKGVGELINRLYTDPDRVMDLLKSLIKLVCKSIVIFFVLGLCFHISWLLGLEVLVFGFIMGYISYKFFPKIKNIQREIKKDSDEYVKRATENITGIREIKALGIKKTINKIMFSKIDSLFDKSIKIKRYEIVYYNLSSLVYFILQLIIFISCGYLVCTGKIPYSIFIVVEAYIWRIDEVVESIGDFGIDYNKVTVSLNRIDELINNKLYEDEKFGKKNIKNIKGVLEFKNTSFRYSDEEDEVINNLNLKLVPNKKIAIVGKSGNGKSTIFNLILRYFDITKGEILLDGVNIKDLTEDSLRNNISIIRQTPFLFNMSIFDNFRLVKEDVTLEEMRDVCKKAYIDNYIMSLPKGYDTVIGEGGVNLSGGQKQRLAIARTLLLNTKIILFDEATSALDNESQEYIKKTIDDLVKNHTVIIVAHRLSTIVDADEINIIEKGSLLDSGKHKELLKSCNVYKNLYLNEDLNSK